MIKNVTRMLAMTASAAGLLLTMSSSALAASTWNSQSNCNVGSGVGNSIVCGDKALSASDVLTATITAWSTAGPNSPGFSAATATRYMAGYNFLGGFGVVNQGTNPTETGGNGQHSIDNVSGTDVLLVKFSSEVTLKQLTIGWKQTDADVTVLRFAGSGDPSLLNKTSSQIQTDIANDANNGWDFVGSYGNLATGVAKDVNAAAKSSSWWLISAYNSTYGGSGFSGGDDLFKLLSFAGDKKVQSSTPEPGSLALAAVALAGVVGTRRKFKKNQQA